MLFGCRAAEPRRQAAQPSRPGRAAGGAETDGLRRTLTAQGFFLGRTSGLGRKGTRPNGGLERGLRGVGYTPAETNRRMPRVDPRPPLRLPRPNASIALIVGLAAVTCGSVVVRPSPVTRLSSLARRTLAPAPT